MRTITAGMFITLDGVIEAPEKWNPPYYDEELNRAVLPQFTDSGLHLYGRRSYELFRAVFTGPAAPPHAAMMTSTPKVVVSATLADPGWGPTTLISGNVAAELTELKQQPGGPIAVAASGTLVRFLLTDFRCAAQAIANALTAEEQGYDAFVIGNFQEAGLAGARSAVRIPVIGLGEATMLHACTLGRKIGLVATTPVHIPYHQDQIARHGLHRRVIAVQAVQADTGQFNRAFDDEREYRSLREAFVSQAEPMLGLGIDVIIPAGGYPMLLFTREQSFAIGGATVLNGLPVAVAAAETAVRLSRLNGTGTSRRTAYALPPSEAVTEFRSAFTADPPQYA